MRSAPRSTPRRPATAPPAPRTSPARPPPSPAGPPTARSIAPVAPARRCHRRRPAPPPRSDASPAAKQADREHAPPRPHRPPPQHPVQHHARQAEVERREVKEIGQRRRPRVPHNLPDHPQQTEPRRDRADHNAYDPTDLPKFATARHPHLLPRNPTRSRSAPTRPHKPKGHCQPAVVPRASSGRCSGRGLKRSSPPRPARRGDRSHVRAGEPVRHGRLPELLTCHPRGGTGRCVIRPTNGRSAPSGTRTARSPCSGRRPRPGAAA